ncbi:ATP-dependent zinc protease [Marinobacter salinisoli]|uniref:ATP-dependent zinc protease n=1 Tax=Marinobacter salinisoli TaxID=2769486 RepID=A0ABX7MNM9_9GAMM|nr:ATP-dependent zinc protease [Marinobacter salinisoli]QSP93877.1 ATP-dependent zinc protease [Marinobacter salinisoli]
MKILALLSSLLLGLAPVAYVHAEESKQPSDRVPETLGFVEWVVMNDTMLRLKARLDTGAKTSSLHATNVEEFTRGGEEWVRFQLPLGDHEDQPTEGEVDHDEVVLEFERPIHRTIRIKRKGADSQRRHVVKMEFCIAGTVHETQFSLTDRSNFSYPVLLGRRFMRDDNILTDSANSFIAQKECDYSTLEEIAKLDVAE